MSAARPSVERMSRSYEKISAADFSAAEGVDDWRVLWWQAFALFRTKSFVTGLALVNEIGRLAEEANHHPDDNLRYGELEIRLSTHDTMSLTDADLDLARKISAAARSLGVEADPGAIRTWEFALDALDVDAVRRFWAAVLGYRLVGDTDIADPIGLYPPVYVQQMDTMREGRNRIHIDLAVPHEEDAGVRSLRNRARAIENDRIVISIAAGLAQDHGTVAVVGEVLDAGWHRVFADAPVGRDAGTLGVVAAQAGREWPPVHECPEAGGLEEAAAGRFFNVGKWLQVDILPRVVRT